MRFKKYILLSLVLCGFAACSDDNEIEIPKAPVLEKAQLALAIKSEEGAVTKTGETNPTDADVNTLTVGVFGVDGWSVIYTKDATPNSDGTKDVGPQEVYAGEAHVVVVANAAPVIQTELAKAKDITDFIETTINLSDETLTKGLTMSSKVLDVTLVANTTNYIGYDDEVGDITVKDISGKEVYGAGPVPLVRDVASIALAGADIGNPENANYESKSFVLKEVFIASAKGVSSVASTEEWGTIEKDFFGDTHFGYLDYKVGLLFLTSPNNIDEGSYKKGLQTKYDALAKKHVENDPALNHEFYVYENTKGEVKSGESNVNEAYANHTLLIVKGDYTYLPQGAKESITKENCYYAIPVGEEVTIDGTEKRSKFYVQRNYKYEISLTIIGPGSEIPYDPMISTNVSASVKVEPWNVKTIHEEVE